MLIILASALLALVARFSFLDCYRSTNQLVKTTAGNDVAISDRRSPSTNGSLGDLLLSSAIAALIPTMQLSKMHSVVNDSFLSDHRYVRYSFGFALSEPPLQSMSASCAAIAVVSIQFPVPLDPKFQV